MKLPALLHRPITFEALELFLGRTDFRTLSRQKFDCERGKKITADDISTLLLAEGLDTTYKLSDKIERTAKFVTLVKSYVSWRVESTGLKMDLDRLDDSTIANLITLANQRANPEKFYQNLIVAFRNLYEAAAVADFHNLYAPQTDELELHHLTLARGELLKRVTGPVLKYMEDEREFALISPIRTEDPQRLLESLLVAIKEPITNNTFNIAAKCISVLTERRDIEHTQSLLEQIKKKVGDPLDYLRRAARVSDYGYALGSIPGSSKLYPGKAERHLLRAYTSNLT